MQVYGYELTPEQLAAMQEVAQKPKFFTKELVNAALKTGVPAKGVGENWNRYPAKHAASTIIQKLKKAGEIIQKREGLWARVSANDEQFSPAPTLELA